MTTRQTYDPPYVDPRRTDIDRPVAPTGQCTELGSFNVFAGAHVHEISVIVDDNSLSIAKHYTFAPLYNQYASGVTLIPERNSGPFGASDFELIAIVNLGVVSYRLRRTGGSTAGTYRVHIKSGGKVIETFTPSTTVINPCNTVYPLEPSNASQIGNGGGGGLVFYASNLDGNWAQVGSNHTKDSNVQPAVVPRNMIITRVALTAEKSLAGAVNSIIIRKNGPATVPIATLLPTSAQQVFVVNLALVQGDTINITGTNTAGNKIENAWISLS